MSNRIATIVIRDEWVDVYRADGSRGSYVGRGQLAKVAKELKREMHAVRQPVVPERRVKP